MNIPLSRPDITEKEIEAVTGVLRTPNLSLGPKLQAFEGRMAEYIGTRFAIAVNSGTSGLHLCVRALGIGPGDEVITTPFSFIASANCILYERAKPVFVDIEEKTLNIDPARIEQAITPRTKAMIAVDIFGRPCQWEPLEGMAAQYQLKLIEDACEALGSEYRKKKTGRFGDCAAFGFYPNKQITTGEGGIIVTDNESLARLCKSMRNQGRGDDNGWMVHERLGFNYRMSDIHCALGIAQLERIEEILKKRAQVAEWYGDRLKEVPEVTITPPADDSRISWFVYVVRLGDHFTLKDRNSFIRSLRQKGIGCSAYLPVIHLQPFYRKTFGYKEGDFPIAEHIAERTIALPFYTGLLEKEVAYVVERLKEALVERR
ncbi:MAG: DegT/DnrJ/EryC1/StrS family aminotransferase [Nitrospirae bacterium]|nr:DegT/DnrJ/EryC1/StrS family aminotransferase [Nitrospirota bacterium]